MAVRRITLVSLLAVATAQVATAQSNIVPDTAPGIGLGTTVSPVGNIHTIDGGTVSGSNLFHSFNAFKVGAGDVAQWVHTAGDPASIDNIINRVTGGSPSDILGELNSTAIPGADFYFINPAGVVFGQGAQVNVPAAAHFSTAGELRFANGDTFSIATPSGSSLSIAAPQAFGFLGTERSIVANGLFVAVPGELTLSATEIDINDSFLLAGELALSATGSDLASVAIVGPVATGLTGPLKVTRTDVVTLSDDVHDGAIRLSGGTVWLDQSTISSDSLGVLNPAAPIQISAMDSLGLSNSSILSASYGTENGANIEITSPSVSFQASIISSRAWTGGGGNIEIDAGNLALDASTISAEAFDGGSGGAIALRIADGLSSYDSFITNIARGAADAGNILIASDSIALSGSWIIAGTDIGTTGNGGNITVDAAGLFLMDGSQNASVIQAVTQGAGRGGDAEVLAGTLEMRGDALIAAATLPFSSGDSGDVRVNVAGELRTVAYDVGGAMGVIGGRFQSTNEGSGTGGDVTIEAGRIHAEHAQFNVFTFTDAPGGNLSVDATEELIVQGGGFSGSTSASGNGGNISLSTGGLLALDHAVVSSTSTGTMPDAGAAGRIAISAGALTLTDGTIESDATGSGNAGSIAVNAGAVELAGASIISTASANPNPAGEIHLVVDRLHMTGAETQISSENTSISPGDAGSIMIATAGARIEEGAQITTNSLNGAAGNINIQMPSDSWLILAGDELPGTITTSSGSGTGGVITIASPLAIISNGGVISALGERGGANVRIDAQYFIGSADRENVIEVDGTLTFTNAIYDVSAGTTDAELTIMDASGVLEGQCNAVRAGGQASQLNISPTGPFGGAIWSDILEEAPHPTVAGGCQ